MSQHVSLSVEHSNYGPLKQKQALHCSPYMIKRFSSRVMLHAATSLTPCPSLSVTLSLSLTVPPSRSKAFHQGECSTLQHPFPPVPPLLFLSLSPSFSPPTPLSLSLS